ncbi:MAG: alpha-amylase/alpha-mannosidase (GH57 family), partial [Hyphomicrobiaceae bacterium]
REAVQELNIDTHVSWADEERNLSAWLGNPMQQAVHAKLYAMRSDVLRAGKKQPKLLSTWRDLTTSDHVYYIATTHHSDAEVHDYFSPYDHPHAAFVTVMTAIDALQAEVQKCLATPEVKVMPAAKRAAAGTKTAVPKTAVPKTGAAKLAAAKLASATKATKKASKKAPTKPAKGAGNAAAADAGASAESTEVGTEPAAKASRRRKK